MRVCFVAPGAYPLFDPSVQRPIGGMETRSVLFARGLARRPGFDVHFIVDDFGQPEVQQIDGVTVRFDSAERESSEYRESLLAKTQRHANRVRECLPRKPGFPGFRIAKLRPSLAWDILAVFGHLLRFRFFPLRPLDSGRRKRPQPRWIYRHIGADACIVFGNHIVAAETVASCRRHGGKSVLFLASDINISTGYMSRSRKNDAEGEVPGICHYVLKGADFILAQTERQQRLLKERFGRDSLVIRNPIVLDDAPAENPGWDRRDCVLWIGRADRHCKRPALLLEMAARLPEVPFVMIMNERHPDVWTEIAARVPPNVRLIERVPPAEMPDYYRRARAFVSTSSFEGFSNAFLQAGKYGAPVVSLDVDPDGMLARDGCGFCAGGNLQALVRHVRQVWTDPAAAAPSTRRMSEYIRARHELNGRVAELEAFLKSICPPRTLPVEDRRQHGLPLPQTAIRAAG